MILTEETEVLGDKPVTVPFWLSQRLHGVARDGTQASALFNEVNRNNMGIQHCSCYLRCVCSVKYSRLTPITIVTRLLLTMLASGS